MIINEVIINEVIINGVINKYVINLDNCIERMNNFDDTFIRWRAIPREEVDEYTDKKLITYYNVSREYHLGCCACLLSHITLWKHIIDNKINNVLILEDDAVFNKEEFDEEVIFNFNNNGILYLGGFFHTIKMVQKKDKLIIPNSINGINFLDKNNTRILMTISYYIPNYKIAELMYNTIINLKRWRVLDSLMYHIPINNYYYYPAIFIENNQYESNIRKNKKKYPNKYYTFDRK